MWKSEKFWNDPSGHGDYREVVNEMHRALTRILDGYGAPKTVHEFYGPWSVIARVAWLGAGAEERKEIEALVVAEGLRRRAALKHFRDTHGYPDDWVEGSDGPVDD